MRTVLVAWRQAILGTLGLSAVTCGGATTSDGSAAVPPTCEDPRPYLPGTISQSSGFVECRNQWLHRSEVLECPSLLPRERVVAPNPVAVGMECTRDSDCTRALHGHCEPGYLCGPGGFCQYGCIRDSECPSGTICLCGDPVGTCVSASCSADSDCNFGVCAGTPSPTRLSDQTAYAFACQLPTDECQSYLECASRWCEIAQTGRECANITTVDCGRPFLVNGVPRTARALRGRDWARPCKVDTLRLTRDSREVLADHWASLGLMEHASIAAFARFLLELLALGAPAELVGEAQRALADEITHAELCFGLASAYAGRSIGPGPLPTTGALDQTDPVDIVRTTFLEACIGETVAAVEARAALEATEEPQVRAVLRRIAEDEARHAELGFRVVSWALQALPADVTRPLHLEIAALVEQRSRTATQLAPSPNSSNRFAAQGILDPRRRSEARDAAWSEIIAPCTRAMLARSLAPAA